MSYMTAGEAEAAHAAELKRIQEGPEGDVATCKARIAAVDVELRTLEGALASVRVSYARGTATPEDFDQADRSVAIMQRRLGALNEALPNLEQQATKAYGNLAKYARAIENATFAQSLARRAEREKLADRGADK